MPRSAVKMLERLVGKLEYLRNRMKDKARRRYQMPPAVKAACLLFVMLGAPGSLGQLFLLHWLHRHQPGLLQEADLFLAPRWWGWLEEEAVTKLLWTALADVTCPLRLRVEMWILEARTAYRIHEQNRKGVVVPFADVFAWHFMTCSKSPCWPRLRNSLHKQVVDPNAAKNWARAFRSRWQLHWGSLPKAKPLGEEELPPRVGKRLRIALPCFS